LFLPVVWWAGAITACAIEPDTNLLQILQVLTEKLDQPFSITYTPYTLRCVFTFTIGYVLGIGMLYDKGKEFIELLWITWSSSFFVIYSSGCVFTARIFGL